MVDLDAAELLSQINELGKFFHHMCCPLICTSGLGAPGSPNCSHLLVLLFSGQHQMLQCEAISAEIGKFCGLWEKTLRKQRGLYEEMFLLSVEGIVGWESLQLSVATGGHCLAIIITSNEIPGTLLGNVVDASHQGST